jgi:hypothetical protein
MAERYGWINRAIPDAELDTFVGNFVSRVLSFDRKALQTARSIINHAGLSVSAALKATQDTPSPDLRMGRCERAASETARARDRAVGDFVLNLSHYLGSL